MLDPSPSWRLAELRVRLAFEHRDRDRGRALDVDDAGPVGAGQIVDYLMSKGEYVLSDSSKLARETYLHSKAENSQKLYDCETALLLRSLSFEESITYVINHFENIHVHTIYDGEKIILDTNA